MLTIYRQLTGHRLHSMRQVETLANRFNISVVSEHAARAIAHDTNVALMEAEYEHINDRARHGQVAGKRDGDVDRAATGTYSYLDVQIRMYGADSERGQAAIRLRDELYPNGPGAITSLPYIQQHERINVLLKRAKDDDLAADVARLPEFPELLDRLAILNSAYGQSLTLEAKRRLSREKLATARTRGQEYLAEVVVLILAHFAVNDETVPDAREELLAPILTQNEIIRRSRRRRRSPVDIDPDGPNGPDGEPDDGSDDEPESEPDSGIDAGPDIRADTEPLAGNLPDGVDPDSDTGTDLSISA